MGRQYTIASEIMQTCRGLEGGVPSRGGSGADGEADGNDDSMVVLVEEQDKRPWNLWHLRVVENSLFSTAESM